MRKGFVISESLLIAIITLITTFLGGAISEAETQGKVTQSIMYDVNNTKPCKE